jgi:ferritin-like protein
MSSENYHEPYDLLSDETKDLHRAIQSLMEELEAVDWYNQRADVTADAQLKAILEHNRDEEIEHAVMVLEWLRRRLPKLDEQLRTILFSEGEITRLEDRERVGGEAARRVVEGRTPTVGSLRGRKEG